MKHLLLFLILLCSVQVGAYDYASLKMADLEEMNRRLDQHIKHYRKKGGASLIQGLKLILSRPDQDGLVGKLFPRLKLELKSEGQYDKALLAVTANAISNLRDEKLPRAKRATAVFILLNLIQELRPHVKSKSINKKVITKIRDSQIKLPRPVVSELRLRMMKSYISPSKVAEQVIGPKK